MNRRHDRLPAREIAEGVRSGVLAAEAVAEACLARIAACDGTVMAWEFLDPDLVRVQARAVDRTADKGALAGVPVGVKDVIDTADMPTALGSPIHAGRRPAADARCVALLRAAGAVVMGKTVTCEFAGPAPGKTANPRDPSRTPGGSSSGSAAAVADGMVPIALGTQTGGSVIRPSSYCGVLGYKPSFGKFDLAGVFPAAPSLDTLGVHARAADDVALAASVLSERPAAPPAPGRRPARVGVAKTWLWDRASSETREAVENAARRMEKAGARVFDVGLDNRFRELAEIRGTINAVERARTLRDEWARDRERLSPVMRATVEEGLAVPEAEYGEAKRFLADRRAAGDAAFGACDVLLCPAVDGVAPPGLDDTGDPRFQSLWTMLGTPAATLPAGTGPGGLPVGVQLVAPRRRDGALLDVLRWAERVLR